MTILCDAAVLVALGAGYKAVVAFLLSTPKRGE